MRKTVYHAESGRGGGGSLPKAGAERMRFISAAELTFEEPVDGKPVWRDMLDEEDVPHGFGARVPYSGVYVPMNPAGGAVGPVTIAAADR